MQCQNCKLEMEKGFLIGNGGAWVKLDNSLSVKMIKPQASLFMKSEKVFAYRCPQCKKIQLIIED